MAKPKELDLKKYKNAVLLELTYVSDINTPSSISVKIRLAGTRRAENMELVDILDDLGHLEDLDIADQTVKLDLTNNVGVLIKKDTIIFERASLAQLYKKHNLYMFVVKETPPPPKPYEPR
ncbi:MAG: hypothetical protein HYT16_02675 [DPANN group archaeon]|nr:hypothetical protein [DPANN group archaeon]